MKKETLRRLESAETDAALRKELLAAIETEANQDLRLLLYTAVLKDVPASAKADVENTMRLAAQAIM